MAAQISELMLAMAAQNVEDRNLCASDLLAFTKRMFPSYHVAEHHKQIALRLQSVANGEIDRLIITMPPRHGKSEMASVHFPAWYLANHPDRRIIACSNTQTLADRFSRQARNKTTQPQWPFPAIKIAPDLGQVQRWDIAGHRGGYIAAGVGGSITGFGGDLILIDDPVKSSAEADSPIYRESTWEWYQGTLRTRLEPGGAIVVIGTRWHEDDLIGRLINSDENWHVLHLPAIDDDGHELWPESEIVINGHSKKVGYSLSNLMRIKRETGTRNFEALYQGRPTPAEGGMFKRPWWQRYRVLPPLVKAELAIDSAFKEGVAADYSAIALWGKDATGSAYLVRVWRARAAFPDLIRLGHDAHAWAASTFPHLQIPLVVEDKASGQSAIQVWKQPYYTKNGVLPALPVIAYAIKGTQSKTARAEGVTPIVEGGRAFIPEQATWLDDWLTEHEAFPLGAHDDQVDTTSMALTRLMIAPRRGLGTA